MVEKIFSCGCEGVQGFGIKRGPLNFFSTLLHTFFSEGKNASASFFFFQKKKGPRCFCFKEKNAQEKKVRNFFFHFCRLLGKLYSSNP